MAKANQIEERKIKEYLKLRWEYLKRSDSYKEFCEFIRKKIKKGTNVEDITYPKKFQKEGGSKYDLNWHIFENYMAFGDIHNDSFERWWAVRKLVKENEANVNDSKGVEIYNFEKDFDFVIESFKKDNDRVPTLQEFKDELLLKNIFRINLYLKIDLLTPGKTEDLVKQIGKIVKERRRIPYIRGLRSKVNLESFSIAKVKENYFRFDELRRYLKVYDYYKKYKKKGLKIKDIINKMRKDSKEENIRRAFYLDLERAKNLIKNAELGNYPGDYQPSGKY